MGDVEDWNLRYLRGEHASAEPSGFLIEVACVALASVALACSEPSANVVPSATASATASSAALTASAPPPARVSWDSSAVPRPGSFLGDATEDFVGAFRFEGDHVELFAVDGATLKIAWRVPIPGVRDVEHPLRFSVVQGFVAWTLRDHTIRVLDAASGQELRTIELSPDTVIDRLCPARTNRDQLMAPTTSGYDAIVYLASGREANNSGLYPRPPCPLVPTTSEPPAATLRQLRKGLVPSEPPELVYRPGFLVARPDRKSKQRVLVGLDELGKPTWERALPNVTSVRSVEFQGPSYFVFGNTNSPPRSAVLSIPIGSDEPGWTTTLPCPASRFVTTPTRIYASTDTLQLHVLDASTGKLLATFGDADPRCP